MNQQKYEDMMDELLDDVKEALKVISSGLVDVTKDTVAIVKLQATADRIGWQVVTGPHLEDWEEGQTVDVNGDDKSIEARVDIAVVKVEI